MQHSDRLGKYLCTDCGHDFFDHNSVIVPWGCTVVDGTSVDCVNGYQGERPPRAKRGIRVELWYPREEDREDTIRISLIDVRAANDLAVRYDFERDGWVVLMPVPTDETDLVEQAFVPAWATGDPE